jgi:hypothetical protein
MESNDCLLVFYSGDNGGYSMCGLIQLRIWIVCSSGEYGWSAPVESREGLLQWRVRMVCFSGNYGPLLLADLSLCLSLPGLLFVLDKESNMNKQNLFAFSNTSDLFLIPRLHFHFLLVFNSGFLIVFTF